MKLKAIHRNLQHVPRIWGVSYWKLFASLFATLLVMMVFFYTVSRGLAALFVGVGVGLAAYGVSFWLDSRDPLEQPKHSVFIRDCLTSYSVSNQAIRIKDHEAV